MAFEDMFFRFFVVIFYVAPVSHAFNFPSKAPAIMPSRKNKGKAARRKKTELSRYSRMPPETVVDQIRRGLSSPTRGAASMDSIHQRRLIDQGLIPAVLDFLKRCKNEELQDIFPIDSRNGDEYVRNPTVWLAVLNNIDVIITSNIKDFKKSKVSVYSPEEYIRVFQ